MSKSDVVCIILTWFFLIIVFFIVGLFFLFNGDYLGTFCMWLFVALFVSMPFLTEEAGF